MSIEPILTPAERDALIVVIEREMRRLDSLEEDYRKATKPRNAATKAMADEGVANIRSRITELGALRDRLDTKPARTDRAKVMED